MCASVHDMLEFLISADAGGRVTIQPTDREGLWLRGRNGETGDELDGALRPLVGSLGWQVTAIRNSKILIEPVAQERFAPQSPYLFHVSDCTNRDGICTRGLVPRHGGNTTMNRTCDPPRIYLAADLQSAFEFVQFQCADKKNALTNIPLNLRQQMIGRAKNRSELDVWRVRVPEGIELYRDVLFPGRAAWTLVGIPRQNLSLVRGWQWRERLWTSARNHGLL